jgi:inorganic pyrophosphatase
MIVAPDNNKTFFETLQDMVNDHPLRIDRPRGSRHPRYPEFVYPLDYGYLEGTSSSDGGGVDVWLGTCQEPAAFPVLSLTGLLLTVDRAKQDVETKLLLNCTHEEMEIALQASNSHSMNAILLKRGNLGANTFEVFL